MFGADAQDVAHAVGDDQDRGLGGEVRGQTDEHTVEADEALREIVRRISAVITSEHVFMTLADGRQEVIVFEAARRYQHEWTM
ncbi:hypothetical protein [Nocardia sp. NPDC056000]|uniref:hypothetical protein n=1 Tax=Nocardia sp. NPDC056000 TaxID=3345674 RepID=UPI0035D84737